MEKVGGVEEDAAKGKPRVARSMSAPSSPGEGEVDGCAVCSAMYVIDRQTRRDKSGEQTKAFFLFCCLPGSISVLFVDTHMR